MVPWFRYNMCPKLVPAMMQTMLRVLAKQVETHSTIGWMLERLLGKKLGKRILVVHSYIVVPQFLAEMWPFCDRRHRVSPHVVNVNLFPGHLRSKRMFAMRHLPCLSSLQLRKYRLAAKVAAQGSWTSLSSIEWQVTLLNIFHWIFHWISSIDKISDWTELSSIEYLASPQKLTVTKKRSPVILAMRRPESESFHPDWADDFVIGLYAGTVMRGTCQLQDVASAELCPDLSRNCGSSVSRKTKLTRFCHVMMGWLWTFSILCPGCLSAQGQTCPKAVRSLNYSDI